MRPASPRRVPPWLLAAAFSLVVCAVAPVGAREPPSPASASVDGAMPKELPLRREEMGASGGGAWTAAMLLVVLGLVAAVLVLRRRGTAALLRSPATWPAGAHVAKLSSLPLTPQASVHAVRWHGEELLLACTSQQVTVLARRAVPSAAEPAP